MFTLWPIPHERAPPKGQGSLAHSPMPIGSRRAGCALRLNSPALGVRLPQLQVLQGLARLRVALFSCTSSLGCGASYQPHTQSAGKGFDFEKGGHVGCVFSRARENTDPANPHGVSHAPQCVNGYC